MPDRCTAQIPVQPEQRHHVRRPEAEAEHRRALARQVALDLAIAHTDLVDRLRDAGPNAERELEIRRQGVGDVDEHFPVEAALELSQTPELNRTALARAVHAGVEVLQQGGAGVGAVADPQLPAAAAAHDHHLGAALLDELPAPGAQISVRHAGQLRRIAPGHGDDR